MFLSLSLSSDVERYSAQCHGRKTPSETPRSRRRGLISAYVALSTFSSAGIVGRSHERTYICWLTRARVASFRHDQRECIKRLCARNSLIKVTARARPRHRIWDVRLVISTTVASETFVSRVRLYARAQFLRNLKRLSHSRERRPRRYASFRRDSSPENVVVISESDTCVAAEERKEEKRKVSVREINYWNLSPAHDFEVALERRERKRRKVNVDWRSLNYLGDKRAVPFPLLPLAPPASWQFY